MSVQALTYVLGHRTGGAWAIPPVQTPSSGARVVLLVLANFADDNGDAYPSIETIAAAADMSPDQARRHVRALVAAGLIETTRNGAPDSRIARHERPNLYRIVGVSTLGHPLASTRGAPLASTRLPPRVDAANPLASTRGEPSKEPSTTTRARAHEPRPAHPTAEQTERMLDEYRNRDGAIDPPVALEHLRHARSKSA